MIKSVTQVRSKLFNFRLKSQLEVALHQHKVLEGELERSKAEVEEQVDTFSIETMIIKFCMYLVRSMWEISIQRFAEQKITQERRCWS